MMKISLPTVFKIFTLILIFSVTLTYAIAPHFDYKSDELAFELVEIANHTFRGRKNIFSGPADFHAWNTVVHNARTAIKKESKNLIGADDENIMRVFTELEACNSDIQNTIFKVYETYVKGKNAEQIRAGVAQAYTLHRDRARVERQSGDSQLLKLSMSRSTLARKKAAIRFIITLGDKLQELCLKAITDINTLADGDKPYQPLPKDDEPATQDGQEALEYDEEETEE